jgi:prophage regulatory protein
MRILSKKELRALVLYSPAHVDRLEKAGLFPKRVRLGPGRVGWIEDEVLDWLQRRIDLRNEGQRTLNNTPIGETPARPLRSDAPQHSLRIASSVQNENGAAATTKLR